MDRVNSRLIDLWRRSPLSRRPRIDSIRHCASRADMPEPLPRRNIVVIGSPPKWAVIACPCGTGHTIDLNLANPQTEQWRLQAADPPSITPSIDVKDPSGRCHFWLRDGRVQWVQRARSR